MKFQRRVFLKLPIVGSTVLPLLSSTKSGKYLQPHTETMGDAKFVDVDGIKTRYFEGGSGEALVLVHGGHFGLAGAAAKGWMPIFNHLAAHFHVYAFDKLGMGFTDNPRTDADYSMKATVQHCYRFLQKMGIQKASLAGSSRGALPVARIAIDHPEMVKALIIFNSNTLAPGDPTPSVPDSRASAEEPPPTKESIRQARLAARTTFQKDHITDEYVEAALEVALLPKIKEAAKKMELLRKRFVEQNPGKVKARPGLAYDTGTGWWMYEVKDETLELIKAGRLKTPTLIVWGFNDPSATYNLGIDLLELISRSLGRVQLHFLNECGHAPHNEYPQEVTDLMVNFINFRQAPSR